MKTVATINFKGGVGKTTITWLLARHLAERRGHNVLVWDTDAQMSLTMAVSLQDNGNLYAGFDDWYDQHQKRRRTILNALERFEDYALGRRPHFDFPVDWSLVYQFEENLHLIPSVVDLYWLEIDALDRLAIVDCVGHLLQRIRHSPLPEYDFCLFDCPPSFSVLSYSVLKCCDMILIPVNPDAFAARGVELMLDGLRLRISPNPLPKVAVFMNKARLYRGSRTRETAFYWEAVKIIVRAQQSQGVDIHAIEDWVPERADLRRAIPRGYVPPELEKGLSDVWNRVEHVLNN